MSIVGWLQWRGVSRDAPDRPITRMTTREHLSAGAIGIGLGVIFGYFFAAYTPAAATYLDATTTAFAILATFMLVQKKLENWLYWIVVDIAYVYLYGRQGAWLFAGLMVIYVIIAALGYIRWRKSYLELI